MRNEKLLGDERHKKANKTPSKKLKNKNRINNKTIANILL